MSVTTLQTTIDPAAAPPSPSDLKALFTPTQAFDSEDEMSEDEDQLLSGDRSFKDSVHGWTTLSKRVCSIIDTPQFQRLRHVKQLGTSYYVWPAASHNRFEHCLGVAHLAQLQVKRLQRLQPELGITEQDVDCVTIAGLCHDLGHGPWSHVWDSMFIPQALPGKKWKHEDASEMMFDDLVKEPTVKGVSEDDATIVKALIAGDPSRVPQLKGKEFLFEIVANKRNGLDVDKFDYIARDCHAIGQGENVSLDKLMHSARVIDGQICYDIKDANSIYELCWSRFSLHKRIYNHKTAKAIEYMIIDAILAAEPYMKIAEQIEDPKRYMFLTDDIKLRIQANPAPELQKAREIFHRIDTRQLYKWVEYKVYPWVVRDICRQRITPATIVSAARRVIKPEDDAYELAQELTDEVVIVDHAEMHYGMKEKNPLNYVKFYSKRKPNRAKHAGSGDISNIMPQAFAEVLLRVYAREERFMSVIQRGFRQVLKDIGEDDQLEADLDLSSPPRELEANVKPPANEFGDDEHEGPTTPRPAKKAPIQRVRSTKFAPDGEGGTESTWNPNPFTDVPAGGSRGRERERDGSPGGAMLRKRGADESGRSVSPVRKRTRPSKA